MTQNRAATAVNLGEGLRRLSETSSSRCVMERGIHNFEVTSNALAVLEGMGIGKFITSSTFSVGGYNWSIRFYPDGVTEGSAGNASAYLCYRSQAKHGVRVKYSLTMLDDKGNAQEINKDYVAGHIFTPEAAEFGFLNFVEKSKLKSISHLAIRCVIDVIKEPPTECKRDRIIVPPPDLPGHLEHALKNGRGADITLLVGGREFKAHSFILAARSLVFDAQLFGPMMNKDRQHIEVADMEPAIFEMLLYFLYTDSLPPCDEEDYDVATMQHLLVAADRYGLDRLKVLCEEKLCESIDVKTVTSTLTLASQHYCERLKDACVEFMSTPGVTSTVLLTEEFGRLTASCSPLVLEKHRKEE